MKNKHISILSKKVFIKSNIVYDLTYGCGGYTSYYLNKNEKVFAIDISYNSYLISLKIFNKNFIFFKLKIKKLNNIIIRFKLPKFNLLIYDTGFNSCQIKNNVYKLNKKMYLFIKYKIFNLKTIFELIKFSNINFIIIILTFNLYDYFKLNYFIKKYNYLKIKNKLPKFFEKSLNLGLKRVIINYVYK